MSLVGNQLILLTCLAIEALETAFFAKLSEEVLNLEAIELIAIFKLNQSSNDGFLGI